MVEYIEFCYSNKVPSSIHRLHLKNKAKDLLQLLNLNDKANYPIFLQMSRREIITHVLHYTYTFINIKHYQYAHEKILKCYGLIAAPGIDEYSYEDVYTYCGKSSLNKIERFTDKWPSRIIYIRPSGKTIAELIDNISKLLADIIIDALSKSKINEPIFNVQLNYYDVHSYWPYITVTTEREKEVKANRNESIFLFNTPIANAELQNYKSEELNEMFAEFDQYVQSKEAWDKGSDLLIKTSRLLTENKLNGKIPVSDDFIVFAVDWSMIPEADEIEDVLLRCGADRSNIKEWKKLKWF